MQFWAPDDGRKNRPKHVEHLTEINKLWNGASCWLYSANILAMRGHMNVKPGPSLMDARRTRSFILPNWSFIIILPLTLCKCTNQGRTTAITRNTRPTHTSATALAMLLLWRLVTGLSIQRPRFKHRPVHVGFSGEQSGTGTSYFLSISVFPLSVLFHI